MHTIFGFPVLFVVLVCAMAAPTASAQPPPAPAPGAGGPNPSAALPEPPLAVVNTQPLTRVDLQRYVDEKWGRQILEDMVDALLVRQAASARGIVATEAEIDDRVEAVRQASGTGGYEQMLRDRGLSPVMHRSQIKTEILLERLIRSEVKIGDAQARAYFTAHQAEFATPARVLLAQIVTASPEAAHAARQALADPSRFQQVAAQYSTGDAAQPVWLTREQIAHPVLREAAFSLQKGQVSNPIRVGGAYHLLYAADAQPALTPTFEQARSRVVETLYRLQAPAPEAYLLALRRRANIDVQWSPYAYMTQEYLALRQIRVVVDDRVVKLASAPRIVGGAVLVPARSLLSEIGAELTWRAATRTLVATVAKATVEITVGSANARSGAKQLAMPVAPQMVEGSLWFTPRAVVEALGGEVTWDDYRNTLFVRSPAAVRQAGAKPIAAL